MNKSPLSRPLLRLALIAMALAALALPIAAMAATKTVAKEGTVESLGKNVLTNNSGRTLYTLSVEKNGHFICTGGCLGTWHPLTVMAGTQPKGPVTLGTVKRPDGRTQVTYKGHPLYAFAGDSGAGEAKGEGFKDVGTWHAATIASSSAMPGSPGQEPSPTPPNPYPSPY